MLNRKLGVDPEEKCSYCARSAEENLQILRDAASSGRQ
ncbi:hypothetical protein SynA1524_01731 [Synechococcus sp. A15-24]|nr:hypothetical protein SynA1524_01731 [Synechococcus sp. A15-24]